MNEGAAHGPAVICIAARGGREFGRHLHLPSDGIPDEPINAIHYSFPPAQTGRVLNEPGNASALWSICCLRFEDRFIGTLWTV